MKRKFLWSNFDERNLQGRCMWWLPIKQDAYSSWVETQVSYSDMVNSILYD